MSNEEFVDIHIDDLATKIPRLLEKHPDSPKFLRILAGLANAIVETAADLGPEAKAYAEWKVGALVLKHASASLRVISSNPGSPNAE
jgi:hypothetical protein